MSSNQYATLDDIHVNAPSTIHVTVYGADWCPWTRRQKEVLEKEDGFTFDFKDCAAEDAGDMCAGIKALPTNEIDGKRMEGFGEPRELVKKAKGIH